MRDLVEEGYPTEIEDFDTRLLVALGMLPPGYDLMSAQMDLLDSGVAGYYDPDTGELVVATPDSDQPLAAIDQITLAHEMIHALTDATLGIPEAIEDPAADPEIIRAEQALIEGDATLGMQQFSLGALGFDEQLAMLTDPRILGAQQEAGEFPYVLSSGLQLPYTGRDELQLRPLRRRRLGRRWTRPMTIPRPTPRRSSSPSAMCSIGSKPSTPSRSDRQVAVGRACARSGLVRSIC